MSRHIVYKDPTTLVTVGFDKPLQLIFVQVEQDFSPDPDIEPEVFDFNFELVNIPIVKAINLCRAVVTEHGSIATTIWDSVAQCLLEESFTQDPVKCNRTIDWTKGVPM